jgi:hypothetical protein
MHEIKCPHCKKEFKIDEAGYADIQKQVRDAEFVSQLNERLALAEKEKMTAIELATSKLANQMQSASSLKDTEIQNLSAKLEAVEIAKKLAISEAVNAVEKE